MDEHRATVLLIEDNPGDARLIEVMLGDVHGMPFHLECADRLQAGLQRLDQGGVDMVLLDLGLPDSSGLDTVKRTHAHAPDVPIIVLTGHDDEVLGVNSVWMGAQDYLVKGAVDSTLLGRAIRYAIGRQKLQAESRRVAFVDDGTGVLNRRAFAALAHEHLQRAHRRQEKRLVVLVRVEGVREYAAAAARPGASDPLVRAADVLRAAFGAGDLLGVVGRDELAALPLDPPEDAEPLLARLRSQVAKHNARQPRRPKLVLHAATALADPTSPLTVEHLLAKARHQLPPEE
jgi:DNA-binding response OmpR family regulator